jgi:two-component system sensor histidine kinase BaeS
VTLRVRLAIAFALVALVTAGVVALATPPIVGRGFAQVDTETGGGRGPGGQGSGPAAGVHARQVEQETTVTLVVVAVVAAAAASVLGLVLARRFVRPLSSLEETAAALAHGDLQRRSGLAGRGDEIGSLGRSFDTMADALDRADRSRRRFFQDAAHELKTPLAVIDATTSAILDGVFPHDDRHLATIRDQGRLLARIVDDLRTVGLAEAGALPLRLGPVRLDELATHVGLGFEAQAGQARIRLRVMPAPPLTVEADRDRLAQALGALLDNAVRHAPAGGEVTVHVQRLGARARVAVADTGRGIAEDDLPFVFDRFYQADPARDRGAGTSGLGLPIVRAIAMAHAGRVGAENVPGAGARVWFELPVQADQT